MMSNLCFPSFVCVGDCIQWSVDGFDITARVEYDSDARPSDFDCYSDEDNARWRDDDWFYCGLVLSVARNGVTLDDHAASLWGIECNITDNNDYLTETAFELQSEALDAARAALARVCAAPETV